MFKKILPFLCSLAPLYAFGADMAHYSDITLDGVDLNITAEITGVTVGGGSGESGVVDIHNLISNGVGGSSASPAGDLYILNSAFGLVAYGDIDISNLVWVTAGRELVVGGPSGAPVAMTVGGDINAAGKFTVENVSNFSMTGGAILSGDDLSITAGTISAANSAVSSTNGATTLNATTGALAIGDLTAGGTSGDTTIGGKAASANDTAVVINGNVQNSSGSMAITADTGDMDVHGFVQNTGTALTLNAVSGGNPSGDITIDNYLTNSGTLTVKAASLMVSGSDPNANNTSFVNSGNATLDISGVTTFVNGMNLSGMGAGSELNITTGTLSLGGGTNIIANDASTVNISVTGGVLNAGAISNGDPDNVTANLAKMSLSGAGVVATSVRNNGFTNTGNSLTITSVYDANIANSGNITITQGVTSTANTTTLIGAGNNGTLQIGGAVSNAGDMILDGPTVTLLGGVSNSGGNVNTATSGLLISGPSNNGVINITGDVTNTAGLMTIWAKDVTLNGAVTNTAGKTVIKGSDNNGDTVSIGSIIVDGGEMDLDAWLGGVTTGSLAVNNGVLNLGTSVHSLEADSGNINVARNVNLAGASTTGSGDLYLTATGGVNVMASNGSITVGGDIVATDATARSATFEATNNTITVNGASGISASGAGNALTFKSSNLDVTAGVISATNGGKVEIYSTETTALSLSETNNGSLVMHGNSFTATNGAINIANGIYFDGTTPTSGMVISPTSGSEFLLKNTTSDNNIIVAGGVSLGSGNTLTLDSAKNLSISGTTNIDNGTLNVLANSGSVVFNDAITTGDDENDAPVLNVTADTITITGLTNNANANTRLTADNGIIQSNAAITNYGTFVANATGNVTFGAFTTGTNGGDVTILSHGGNVTTGAFTVDGGVANVTADVGTVTFDSLTLNAGTTTLSGVTQNESGTITPGVTVTNAAKVAGNIVQGGTDGQLNLTSTVTDFSAASLKIDNNLDDDDDSNDTAYGFTAESGNVAYNITGDADLGASITIASGAGASFTASSIESGDVTNSGTLALNATSISDLKLGNITNNSNLTINTGGLLYATSFTNTTNATATITSDDMLLTGAMNIDGTLYQDTGTLAPGVVKIVSPDPANPSAYTITASSVTVGGINQSGTMTINTSDLTVNGNIVANDLTLDTNMGSIAVSKTSNDAGSVSGGVKIYGLKRMTIDGNYVFDDNSLLHAVVLKEEDTLANNYWADVSLEDNGTLGQITNHADDPETSALVYVGGNFVEDVTNVGDELSGSQLVTPQIGINLRSVVDQGSAIWLLYSDAGLVEDELATKIRNLNVNFCNADGTRCFNYFNALDTESPSIVNADNTGTENNLPIYLSVRDYNNDGTNDSIYIVFDPRFGGPVTVFDIEPIVNHADNSTDGEVSAANALDEMIAGQLADTGFDTNSPIEAIPVAFAGTNLEELANELYNRMEQYVVGRDGTGLANFSRLVQPREIEQVAGSIALNEHTTFRGFEDHMFDEFIWNRNRNLNKLWFDVDFGMFRHDVSDNKTLLGNRFNLTAGFDWQSSSTAILGLAAHVSHMSSDNSDNIDLSYVSGQTINGHNSMSVSDTNVGVGVYLMKALGFNARVYGNAFVDAHLFDISREQNYVSDISGSGTAFSLISEWGLMHDWLNQYLVGNLYARFGYNFGFSIKEDADDEEYMRLKSDGYAILTPGYSLIAQKRIYTSPWFQLRPYASIGVEYDVLGMPDVAKFKFGPAKSYSEYDVEIDPLWANIGCGIEMLSANGLQFGFDYRYQYNNDIQLHNLRLSGSYRF